MAFADYSTTPSANVTIGGVSVAEDCPPGNLNNAVRQLMADGKALDSTVSAIDVSAYLPLAGGTVTANIVRSGKGSHRYNADATLTSGATYFLATGTARPTAAEGVVVFYYS